MVVEIFKVYYTKVYLPVSYIVTSSNFIKKHLSIPQAVSINQYYTLTDFWLGRQTKKADVKKLYQKVVYVLL